MAEVDFHPDAKSDFRDAKRWYLEQNPRAAARFELEFERILEQVTESPMSFPTLDEKHRFAIVRHFPHSIVFRIKEHRIFVLAVAHSSRDSEYWQDRDA